jgi:hypothetical protein
MQSTDNSRRAREPSAFENKKLLQIWMNSFDLAVNSAATVFVFCSLRCGSFFFALLVLQRKSLLQE